MQIISDLTDFSANFESAITLGDFDGFHLGHRKLLKTIVHCRRDGFEPVLLTYDPSPKKILKGLKFDLQIYTRDEKISLLQKFDLRATVFLPFSIEISQMSAKNFLHKILLEKLRSRFIVLGYDHHFGYNRKGNFRYLQLASTQNSFKVNQLKAVNFKGAPLSSSRIRTWLKEGKIETANRALGSPYFVLGNVIRGKGRGKKIGIPTANIHIPPQKLLPKEGVYTGFVLRNGKKIQAIVNIGFNPTFSNIDLSLEAHLFDFKENLYGQTLQLFLLQRIRDEQKFSGSEELIKQIQQDIEIARKSTLTTEYTD